VIKVDPRERTHRRGGNVDPGSFPPVDLAVNSWRVEDTANTPSPELSRIALTSRGEATLCIDLDIVNRVIGHLRLELWAAQNGANLSGCVWAPH